MFRKISVLIITILAAVIAVITMNGFGCSGSSKDPEEYDKAAEAGRTLMEDWLKANRSGAQITRAEAYEDAFIGGSRKLTDYVEGEYSYNGEDYSFLCNTVSEEIFISEGYDEFSESALRYLKGYFQMEDESTVSGFRADIYLPMAVEGSSRDINHSYMTRSLVPADCTDPDEYLADPSSRRQIAVSGVIQYKEDHDMSVIDLEELTGPADNGLFLEELEIIDTDESLDFRFGSGQYVKWDEQVLDDFSVVGEVCYRKTEYDFRKDEISLSEADFTFGTDVTVEKTDNGYSIRYQKGLIYDPQFYIVADSSSDICREDYIIANRFVEGQYDSYKWHTYEEGGMVLKDEDGKLLIFYCNTDMTATDIN